MKEEKEAFKPPVYHQKTVKGSNNERWCTPKQLFDDLHAEFNFVLDAAADAETAKLPRWLGPGSEHPNALDVPAWAPGQAIWINPPYVDMGAWVKHAHHQAAAYGSTVVMLIFATTEASWFHDVIFKHAAEVRFLRGRLSFIDPVTKDTRSTAPKGSCLVVFKPGIHRCHARSVDYRKKAEKDKKKGRK